MKALRWGILATGGIAAQFTQDLITAGLTVSAAGSRSLEKAQAFASRFRIPNAHGRYEDLVADPDVDIVYVATPHPQHAANARLALEAGKHVLVEKPFTLNAREARELVELAREKNLVILEAMWTRFLPHMVRMREILASGMLGEIRSLAAELRFSLPTDAGHRINDLALGGGALLDVGIYPVSLAFDLLGKPVSIKASARFKHTGADAEVSVIMQHRDDIMSTSVAAVDQLGMNAVTIYGSKARLETGKPTWHKPCDFQVVDYAGNVIETWSEQVIGRGMQYQAFEMEHLVRTSIKSAILPPEQTVAIMEALDEIRRQIGLIYPGEN